jgi:hypothetical protein
MLACRAVRLINIPDVSSSHPSDAAAFVIIIVFLAIVNVGVSCWCACRLPVTSSSAFRYVERLLSPSSSPLTNLFFLGDVVRDASGAPYRFISDRRQVRKNRLWRSLLYLCWYQISHYTSISIFFSISRHLLLCLLFSPLPPFVCRCHFVLFDCVIEWLCLGIIVDIGI